MNHKKIAKLKQKLTDLLRTGRDAGRAINRSGEETNGRFIG
jgi:hypothetical protein